MRLDTLFLGGPEHEAFYTVKVMGSVPQKLLVAKEEDRGDDKVNASVYFLIESEGGFGYTQAAYEYYEEKETASSLVDLWT